MRVLFLFSLTLIGGTLASADASACHRKRSKCCSESAASYASTGGGCGTAWQPGQTYGTGTAMNWTGTTPNPVTSAGYTESGTPSGTTVVPASGSMPYYGNGYPNNGYYGNGYNDNGYNGRPYGNYGGSSGRRGGRFGGGLFR